MIVGKSIGSTLLWLFLILLLILLVLYLVWLFTRKRRKEQVGRAEAATVPEAPQVPTAAAVQPAAPVAEVPAAEAAAVPEVPRAPVSEMPADDLTRLEGIGPKVAQVLASIGITTFKALAEADYDQVKQALVDAGWPYMDPAGWIEQAKLAAEGRWEELARLQEELKGGRRR